MDSDDKLSKDMLEQMLKFVPSPDEQHLLDGHSEQLDMFAKADRFLYEMSRYFFTFGIFCFNSLYHLLVYPIFLSSCVLIILLSHLHILRSSDL